MAYKGFKALINAKAHLKREITYKRFRLLKNAKFHLK